MILTVNRVIGRRVSFILGLNFSRPFNANSSLNEPFNGSPNPLKYEGGILSINRITQMNGRGVVIVQLQQKGTIVYQLVVEGHSMLGRIP